jgi:transmembrane 9 superfamily protein 2/4
MDHYIKTGDDNIHMANIIYSLIAIAVLVFTLMSILGRQLWNDFTSLEVLKQNRRAKREERRNRGESEEDMGLTTNRAKSVTANQVAWKKLQGDVFRRPEYSTLMCVLTGMGFQVFSMIGISLFFFTTGLISPWSRWYGAYSSVCYLIVGGMANGYITTRAMKYFGATDWHFAASASSFALPIVIGAIVVWVDFVDWMERSYTAMPFTSICLWVLGWAVLNIPAVYFASYQGYTRSQDQPPCNVSSVHRRIPEQPFYLQFGFQMFFASIVMFSTVMFELHYVITSVWHSWLIGMFFFLFVNLNLTMCVVSLISVTCTYLNLRAGNWKWWWRAFFNGLGVGAWVIVYMLGIMIGEFEVTTFASDLVYLSWSLLFGLLFGVMCGTISLFASWFFVTVIYMSSKSD